MPVHSELEQKIRRNAGAFAGSGIGANVVVTTGFGFAACAELRRSDIVCQTIVEGLASRKAGVKAVQNRDSPTNPPRQERLTFGGAHTAREADPGRLAESAAARIFYETRGSIFMRISCRHNLRQFAGISRT